jgi:dipeptide/tripeptide permease
VLFFLFRKQLVEVGNDIDKRSVPLKHWMIFVAGSVAMLGVVYFMFSNLDLGKNVLYALGAMALIYFCVQIKQATPYYRYRMLAVLVMLFILVCYYFYYGQMLTSMNMYAINMMDDQLFGLIPIKPESNAAFNPLWVFILGAPTVMLYGWLDKKGIEISIPSKFAAAFIASAIAFSILGLSTSNVNEAGKVGAEWIFWTHFFQAAGELIVGALAVGFIFKMVPKHLSAFAIGLRSITLSLSGILAAVISTKIALPKDIELTTEVVENVYGGYFYNLAIMAVVAAIVTLLLSKVIANLIAKGDVIEKSGQVEYAEQKAN